MTSTNGSAVSLCSPELLVLDAHPLWEISQRSKSFYKYEYIRSTFSAIKIFPSSPEITSSTWAVDSNCFNITLPSSLNGFSNSARFGGLDSGSMNQLVLLTGYYLVAGQSN